MNHIMPVQSIILLAKTKLLPDDDFPFLSKDMVSDSNVYLSLKMLLTRINRLGNLIVINVFAPNIAFVTELGAVNNLVSY